MKLFIAVGVPKGYIYSSNDLTAKNSYDTRVTNCFQRGLICGQLELRGETNGQVSL